jgi:hypothetical protein
MAKERNYFLDGGFPKFGFPDFIRRFRSIACMSRSVKDSDGPCFAFIPSRAAHLLTVAIEQPSFFAASFAV